MIDENATPTVTAIEPKREKPKSRIFLLVVVLNLLLLGGLLYKSFGHEYFNEKPGVYFVLINDTPSAMTDMSFEYPGGKLNLPPRLESKKQIGSSLQIPGEFEAVIAFKDESGNAYREPIKIKPVGEFLLLLYVLPVLEKAEIMTKDGQAMTVLKPSTSRARILPCYRGEDNSF